LEPERDNATIIERTLRYGNRMELSWLFNQYSRAQIKNLVLRWRKIGLPEPHRSFWNLVLDREEG
jgi:hypothetical protein